MKQNNVMKLVTAALMAAVIFTVTRIYLPVPGSTGYIHTGDSFVLLAGIILGPIYGGLASGIGSMMCDILSPYVVYAPATFILKLSAAALAYYSYKHIRKNSVLVAGLLGSSIITIGYFIYDNIINTLSTAIYNASFNLIQNVAGIIIACILLPILKNIPQIKAWISQQ